MTDALITRSTSPLAIAAPVVEVTVLEDRAHVVRRGRLALPVGSSTIAIAGVAPVLADKTVTAAFTGGAVRVVAVQVQRRRLVKSADLPKEVAALETVLRGLEREQQRVQEASGRIGGEAERLRLIRQHTLKEIGDDAAWGRDTAGEWRASLDRVGTQEAALIQRAIDSEDQAEALARRIADVQGQLQALRRSGGPVTASIVITVETAAAGESELRLSYLVPGACWRPWHTATLGEGAAATVAFACAACVWQNTGEDWTGVELLLSTERASLGVSPPTLAEDPLHLRRKEAGVVVEVRDQVVEDTGGEGGAPAAEVPGIDDGGETRLLRAQSTATVPSDGQPHRFPLFDFSAPAEAALVLIGELAPAAITKTSQANLAPLPLLAGPVDLIRRGGLAGRSSILFVAPGARFDLGWGPDGEIRVEREHREHEEKLGLLASWPTTAHRVVLHLSNLAATPRTIAVVERVPVSELDKVQIAVDAEETKPAAKVDGDGFVRWTTTVPARGHQRLALTYRVKKHPDVVGV